jgi:hypothetical protein
MKKSNNKYQTFTCFKTFSKSIPKKMVNFNSKSLEKNLNKYATSTDYKNQSQYQHTRLALQSKIGFQVC